MFNFTTYSYGDVTSPDLTAEIINRLNETDQAILANTSTGGFIIVRLPVEGGAAFASPTPYDKGGKGFVDVFNDEDIFQAAIDQARGAAGFYGIYERPLP